MARFLQAMLIAVPALLEALVFLSKTKSGSHDRFHGHHQDHFHDNDYFGG
ncbi:MAG: hypothetical protein LBC63_01035 [Holophagales bacterium]|jgi:hypothetical protein|nr:hypothetical protein [Holophagales bacterium]